MIKIPNFSVNFVTIWRFVRRYVLRKKYVAPIFFGLKRDTVDYRDRIYKSKVLLKDLPESTNFKNISAFEIRYKQELSDCVANGILYAFRHVLKVNGQEDFNGSRLYVYFNAREEASKGEDCGASIRSGIKSINTFGVCQESTWPYIVNKFSVTPSFEAYREGQEHQCLTYERIFPVTKQAIMDAVYRGYPVIYGKKLFDSFLSNAVKETGIVPIPKKCWENEIGNHCMVIFDYEKNYTIEPNSWGEDWGFLRGCCRVPWEYVLNPKLCFDFWVIYLTE